MKQENDLCVQVEFVSENGLVEVEVKQIKC